MKILITTLVRNNEKWLPHFYTMIERLRSDIPDITFNTYIYENDSTDSTKKLLRGEYYSTDLGHSNDNHSRTQRLAWYRNDLKKKTENRGNDYVLMVDSNMTFGTDAFKCLLKTLQTNKDIAMACPYAMVTTSLPCEFYYDTFAMKKGQFDSIFECTLASDRRHDRHCHHTTGLNPHHLSGPSAPRLVEVDTCFGGFVLLRSGFYDHDDIWWGVGTPRDCEHWMFCDSIRKHGGRIVIDRHAKVLWTEVF